MCSGAPVEVLAALEADVAALTAEPLEGASDGGLLDRSRRLVAARNRIDAALAATVRTAENRQAAEHDGLKNMRSWLGSHTRLAGPAIGSIARQGRAMEQLPAVQAAYLAGQLTADQVETIAEIVQPEHLDRARAQDVDLTVITDALISIATSQPHRALQAAVGTYLARLDPDGAEPDPTEERSLTLAQHPDGSWTLGGALDAVGGDRVATTLEAIAAAGRGEGDTRTRAQRHADALVQLCDLALSSGALPILRTVKPHVVVTINDRDLADPAPGHGTATTGTGAAISAARARWIACDSTVARVVMGPDSVPLDVGRTQRLIPPHLRRALDTRDRGCVFTGCTAPTWWCDAHHLLHWALGGETSLENSALLCERHHTKVHHGFRIERRPDGRWHTYRPDGTEITTGPPGTTLDGQRGHAGARAPGAGVLRP